MQTLEQILSKAARGAFPAIIMKTREMKGIHNLFCRFLSSDLAEHCQLAKIEDNKLHVVVDSAVWGARLRYAIPDILKNIKFQPEFKGVDKIQYHISTEPEVSLRKIKKNTLSELSEQLWRQALLDLKKTNYDKKI